VSRGRATRWLLWGLLGIDGLLILAAIILETVSAVVDEDAYFIYVGIGLVLGYGGVGGLIASRQPGNTIGWLFCGVAAVFALTAFTDEYVAIAVTRPALLPFSIQLAWVSSWVFVLALEAVPLVLLLFPTGEPPSRRWRPLIWAVVALGAMVVAGFIVGTNDLEAPDGYRLANPTAIRSLPQLGSALLTIGGFGSLAAAFASLAALILRFRHATGDERQQIRWLAYVGLAMLVLLAATIVSEDVVALNSVLFFLLFLAIAVGIPTAAGIAILKFHLYDIDVVIRKTLIYGALAGFITGVYVLVVVLIGALTTDALVPSIVATTIVAAAFQPVRERVTRVANGLVFGTRAAPYEVLARFSDRVGAAYAVDDVMERAARVIAEGTGAERAEVWVRVAGTLQRATSWPRDDGDEPSAEHEQIVPVVHQGENLGEIRIRTSPAHPLRPTEEKLLRDLAAQTGSILRNLGLMSELEERIQELSRRAEELRASRSRIVQAHDAERRRLERNIHDGAQQHLVALAVKLRLAGSVAAKDPAKAEAMLRELHEQTDAALRTLLDLASGIYPAVLEDQGIGPALQRQAGTVGSVVQIEAEDLERLPIETEAAVYFVCLEAMQNAAKYARASRVLVHLAKDDGLLMFSVADDGVGFDAAATGTGSGLQNMRDRLASFGGDVRIDSSPGRGTTVSGRVPIRKEARV
jgi:signal transduction histidine kinase